MSALEAAARAMCVAGGFDPDEMMSNDGPRWRYYVPSARAALAAYFREMAVSEAMEKAGSTELTGIPFIGADRLRIAFKAMSAKLAEEIQ